MPSLTLRPADLTRDGPLIQVAIAVGALLEESLRQRGQAVSQPVLGKALIDTGAARTVVREEVVRRLGLHPVGSTTIHTASHSNIACDEFLIRVAFPNDVAREVVAIAAQLHGSAIECLIGRDLLHDAVFIYTGRDSSFALCF